MKTTYSCLAAALVWGAASAPAHAEPRAVPIDKIELRTTAQPSTAGLPDTASLAVYCGDIGAELSLRGEPVPAGPGEAATWRADALGLTEADNACAFAAISAAGAIGTYGEPWIFGQAVDPSGAVALVAEIAPPDGPVVGPGAPTMQAIEIAPASYAVPIVIRISVEPMAP